MRVLVCGGRDYQDRQTVFSTLSNIHNQTPITMIINGNATGADTLSSEWAEENDISTELYNAKWDLYGLKAGPIRNQQMIDEGKPDLAVVFPGGKGTFNMTVRLNDSKIKYLEVTP